ncbi:alpha-mannosidase [Primorskyibacter sp. S187A]|uniref:alpha-mannosidase n=1 Tax=Primorskyibacter sp. S187A TaxID=3415130 RepID=UPI003C7991C9
MSHANRFTAEKIRTRLDLLRTRRFAWGEPLAPFRLHTFDTPETPPEIHPEGGAEIPWESHWARPDTHFLLTGAFTLPSGWDAPALHLPLGVSGDIFTHPEALLYIDGQPIASADRYHHTIPLDPGLADGRPRKLALHGWTGWTSWPPDPNDGRMVFMGTARLVNHDIALEDFVTRAEVALDVAENLDDERPEKHRLLNALDDALLALDTRGKANRRMRRSLEAARARLDAGIAAAGPPMEVDLHAIGHAHMDVAYLWPTAQIRQKNARTYSNVLRLMEEHPDYRFSHSQPQLYDWTRQDFPEIFDRIKDRVAAGQWEPMGAMWVEPDCNMPSGEALVRQIQLGRGFFRTHFGETETPILWLPDTFGFPACLPQLMAQAGLKWFCTNKLNWNQYNQVQSSTWWEGLDGTRVLAHVLTTPRDVQYLPFPTNYKSDLTAPEVLGTWRRNTLKHTVSHLPICFGYGDGGGGPTEELIQKAKAYAAMPGAPRLTMSTVRAAFEKIEESGAALPLWSGELYLEGHRGVLTSQAWIKRANRRAEIALHKVEALAALARLAGDEVALDLGRAWELLCLNQFHDILTGTSISQVFNDARADFDEIEGICAIQRANCTKALTDRAPEGAEHLVANLTSHVQTQHVVVPGPVALMDGTALPGQSVEGGVLVQVPEVPSYGIVPLRVANDVAEVQAPVSVQELSTGVVLENAHVRVQIDGEGRLSRVWDKEAERDVLAPGAMGNLLHAFEDRPICWDAWDIDTHIEDRCTPLHGPATVEILEHGPLRVAIRVEMTWAHSRITQVIKLHHDSKRIDFETEVDWHETHTLLKVAFPVDIRANSATYDIQWGQVHRPTHRNTSWDAAQFEVPAHRWVDLWEPGYGVALLNDCKYGHDVRDNVLRLTLIKSSTMPDPQADQGLHHFTYSLFPHIGDWREGRVREAAALLNDGADVLEVTGQSGALPEDIAVDQDFVVIETILPGAEENTVFLRLYEAHGRRGPVRLRVPEQVLQAHVCDLLNTPDATVPVEAGRVKLSFRPHEIKTLRLTLA